MFYKDLFIVALQRRPVASRLTPCVDTWRMAGKIQFGIDWMDFISFGEKNKIYKDKFVNYIVSIVFFSDTRVKE